MAMQIDRAQVVAAAELLPTFPRVVSEILATADDPNANLTDLVALVSRDAALAGRVYARANAAASRSGRASGVRDLHTAVSLIGLSRLRELALTASLACFLHEGTPGGFPAGFWSHCAAAGVSAQQLAAFLSQSADAGLIAGLLHDVGQLWMYRHDPDGSMAAWRMAKGRECSIEEAERRHFGTDHAQIGAWLAEHWGMPRPVCLAIRHHHAPDVELQEPMVATLHLAEVLSNALDLGGSDARVTYLSARACRRLGMRWDESAERLFGRIDAISRYVTTFFANPV